MPESSKSSDKKKLKKQSETSRSKDKEGKKKTKKKDNDKERKTTFETDETLSVSLSTTLSRTHDPDAIQLFRRYDRNRCGILSRLDFLQLVKDYADPRWGAAKSRPSLSLTDTSGIPLGYQRANSNSEFEAGQLFERYDRDHTGGLTLDTFHVFFRDFQTQLQAFVEENNYRILAAAPAPAIPQRVQEDPGLCLPSSTPDGHDGPGSSPKALRAKYRAALWKLRKLCKNELRDQRDQLIQHMTRIREHMTTRQHHSSRSENVDETKRYEAMEDDLDRLDELVRYVQRYLNKGDAVSLPEMQHFVDQADERKEQAQCLSMKDYGEIPHETSRDNDNDKKEPTHSPLSSLPARDLPLASGADFASHLRVKDQMIYHLLQERTALQKERKALQTSLQDLSDVSMREMKKWARLTDDMQAEIEHLRSQVRQKKGEN